MTPPTGKGLVLATLMALAFYYSGFFVILTPTVFSYILVRYGFRRFAASFAAALMVVSAIALFVVPRIFRFYQSSPQWEWVFPIPGMNLLGTVSHQAVVALGVGYFVFLALAALAVGSYFRSRVPFAYIIRVSLGGVVLLALMVAAYALANEASPAVFLKGYYTSLLNEFIALQEQAGLPQDQLDFVRQYLPQIATTLYVLTPSFVFLSVLTILLLNLILFKRLFGFLLGDSKPLNEWNVPFSGVWITILALSLLVGWIYGLVPPIVTPFVGNTLAILSFLYYIQGIAIISHYFDKRRLGLFPRLMVYGVVLIFFQMSGVALIVTGFFDAWFDFRKIQEPEKK